MSASLRVSRHESSLRERTTSTLRAAVLDGHFVPGQKLSERELCEQLEVSRPCLREALQHLQAEGLITIVPHRGPEVSTIQPDEVREIYEVRERLESLVGQGFATHASDAQRLALRNKLHALHTLCTQGMAPEVLKAKNEFYELLMGGCGNHTAGQMLRQLNNRVTVLRRLSMAQPGRLPEMLSELEGIVRAIELRDGELAGRLCLEHVRRAATAVLQHTSLAVAAA